MSMSRDTPSRALQRDPSSDQNSSVGVEVTFAMWPGVLLFVLGMLVWAVGMPWAREHDRRVGEKRVAAGKSPSIVPKWVAVLIACAVIVLGGFVYNWH